jgi:hypothetical protein
MVKELASTVVENLKNSPLMLGVLMLNLIMVGGLIYIAIKVGEANSERYQMILERCLPKDR